MAGGKSIQGGLALVSVGIGGALASTAVIVFRSALPEYRRPSAAVDPPSRRLSQLNVLGHFRSLVSTSASGGAYRGAGSSPAH